MAVTNPWMTVGVLSGGGTNMQPFLQSLSRSMSPLVQTDGTGGGGGSGGTFTQQIAPQANDPAAQPAAGQNPLFPTKTSKTNKNYKDPRNAAPGWMGGSNLFDDDSHGANVMGQIVGHGAAPGAVGGSMSGPSPGGDSGGSSGGGGHHGGHGGHGDDHHGGGWGGYGGHLGPIGRAIAGRFGRWW